MIKLPVVYSQHDTRWKYDKLGFSNSTIGSHGCTITAYSMLAEYYGHHVTPGEFNQIMKDRNLYLGENKNLYSMSAINKIYPDIIYRGFVDANPLKDENIFQIRTEINNRLPVILRVAGTNFVHYVLAIGYDDLGFQIADPRDGTIINLRDRYGSDQFAITRYVFHTGTLQINKMPKLDFTYGPILADTKGKFNPSIGQVDIVEQRENNVVIKASWPDGADYTAEVPLHELTILNRDTRPLDTLIEQQGLTINNLNAQLKTCHTTSTALQVKNTELNQAIEMQKSDLRREMEANKLLREQNTELHDKYVSVDAENNKLSAQIISYSTTIKKERQEWEAKETKYKKEIEELRAKIIDTENVIQKIVNFILDIFKK